MSKGYMNAFTTFLAFKKQFGRNRGSDVLSRRMAHRIIMCLLEVLKNDFGEVVETMFQSVERQSERNILHPGQKERDLDEFTLVMF
jgi:hypothetical protein